MKIDFVVRHINSDERIEGSIIHEEGKAVSEQIGAHLENEGYTPSMWVIEQIIPAEEL